MKLFNNKLFLLFDPIKKRKAYLLFFFMGLASVLEMLSIGLILPMIGLFLNSTKITENIYIKEILLYLNISPDNLLFYFILLFFLVYFLKILFLIYITWYEGKFITTFVEKLSGRLFLSYIRQSFSFFIGKNSAELFRNTILEIENAAVYFRAFFRILLESLIVFSLLILLFFVSPTTTLITLLVFLIVSLGYLSLVKGKIKIWGKQRLESTSKRIQFLQEGIGAVKDIKLLGRESFFFNNFKIQNLKLADISFKIDFFNQLPRYIFEFTAISVVILIFLTLNISKIEFEEIFTILALYIAVAFKIMPSINRIVNSIQLIKFVDPSVTTLIDEIKNLDLTQKEEIISDEKIFFKKEILVDIKEYYYKKNTGFNLKDISFSINKGDKIGIIGPSGAGKSTLVEVLLGVLKPTIGDVKVDARSIYFYQKSWKKMIGYIPQQIFIMDDTFRSNILFGLSSEKYDDNILIELIKKVKLDKLLERLPNGLDHKVGERGINLSGGEIQRIGIARALIYEPQIIFFDEATSSLDTFTERKILDEINNIKNKTFITVAHKLETLKNCNKIYRLDNGKIIDSGDFKKFNL